MTVAAALTAQPAPIATAPEATVVVPRTTVHRLTAENGRAYRLRIYHPPGPAGARYPVFIVLDGNFYFLTAVETARALAFSGEVPPMVVVGVELETAEPVQNARIYDFTTPVGEGEVPERMRMQHIATGGLPSFARFVTDELVPFVEREERTETRCRALFGHSLAGLVTLYLLRHRPEAFQSYIAASPSLWWGNRHLLADFTGVRRNPTEPHPRLLITVGALEQEITEDMRRSNPAQAERVRRNRMVDNAVELGRMLSGPAGSADTTVVTFEGETHTSVAPAAISRALRFAGSCAHR